METHLTQAFDPHVEDVYFDLDGIMSRAIRDISFASLSGGTVDPKVAKKVADRTARNAAKAYQRILDGQDLDRVPRTLGRLLAELTVSSTALWVAAQHDAIRHMAEQTKGQDDRRDQG